VPTRSFTLWASISVLLIFVGLNVAVQNWTASSRMDMTQNKLYTLSDAAEKVTTTLAEPIELTFVFSRSIAAEYPAIRTYGARVRELLAAISVTSKGNVVVREIDPAPPNRLW